MTTTSTAPATDRQVAFLLRLGAERAAVDANGAPLSTSVADLLAAEGGDWGAAVATLDRRTASTMIDGLLARPHVSATRHVEAAATSVDVPAGHYAVASATGNNDLDFYRVDRPDEGRWAGRTFVKRVIGGRPDVNVRGAEATDALRRIAADPDAAARYGQTIGRCYRCNRHLTDETSRALGIGPDCRSAS